MTPKEKSLEIFNSMLAKNPTIQDGVSMIDTIQAKLCAIVCVDEIIKTTPILRVRIHENNCSWIESKLNIEYWEQVKQEIENL